MTRSRFVFSPRPQTLAALAVLLGGAGCGKATDQPVVSIHRQQLDQVLAAYGTPEARAAVHSYRMTGTLHATMRQADVKTVRTFARPDSLRVEIAYPDHAEIRIVADTVGWGATPTGDIVPVQGALLSSMVLQAARADLPWLLEKRGADAVPVEPMEVDGQSLPGFELKLGGGRSMRIFLDPTTNLISRAQTLLVSGSMHTVFETVYSDFRDVNGVKFPFHEESTAGGMPTGATDFESVEVNPPADPARFGPGAPAPKSS